MREITAEHFPDGFTILAARGAWFDPARQEFVEEDSRQILVTAKSAGALRAWCAEIGAALAQHELMIVEVGRTWTWTRRRRGIG